MQYWNAFWEFVSYVAWRLFDDGKKVRMRLSEAAYTWLDNSIAYIERGCLVIEKYREA